MMLKTKVLDYKKDAELFLKELQADSAEEENYTFFEPQPDAKLELHGRAGYVHLSLCLLFTIEALNPLYWE